MADSRVSKHEIKIYDSILLNTAFVYFINLHWVIYKNKLASNLWAAER